MEYDMTAQNELIIAMIALGVLFLCLMQYLFVRKQYLLSEDRQLNASVILVFLIIIGCSLRLAIAFNMPGYATDVECFLAWSDYVYTGGFENFYNGDFFADYPPLYIYILYIIGAIRHTFDIAIMSPQSELLIRMPSIIGDILLSIVVFKMASKHISNTAGIFLSLLILLNPAVMINSSLWGQVDILITLMMVLFIYLLYKKRLLAASAVFVLSVILKPQALMLTPLLIFVFIREIILSKDKKKSILTLIASAAVMVVLFIFVPLPFGINKEPLWLIDQLSGTINEYPQTTLNAFNIYGLAGLNFMDASQIIWLGIPLNVWGYIFIVIICAYALWLFLKNPDGKYLFALAAFIILSVYAFVFGMHERYLCAVPILLLIAYILIKDYRLFTCSILLFGVLLCNQALSLYFYQVYMPNEITITMSAIATVFYCYTIYVISMLAIYKPLVLKENDEIVKLNKILNAENRLKNFATQNVFSKKDILPILIITVIYGVTAFINLGSFEIPQSSATLDEDIVIDLGEQQDISQFRYYADYGEGTFTLSYSNDGINYIDIQLTQDDEVTTEYEHKKGMLYKWIDIPINVNAKYLKITPIDGALSFLEIALTDENADLIDPYGAAYGDGRHISTLFDEQNLVPKTHDYMSEFYFDELYHVRTAYENIHQIQPYEITHPPLGKIILAIGIKIWGMNAFGWRFMGTCAGIVMLPVIYALTKYMTKSIKFSAFAAILFAADFMHFAQTRIGTIDSYSVLWIMLMYLFMYKYTMTNFNRESLKTTLAPLFLSGLFFGIGAATKWLCIYAGLGLLAIFLIMMYRRYQEYKFAKTSTEYPSIVDNYKKNLCITLISCVFFFIIIPALIYILSYAPYFDVKNGYAYTGISDIIDNQKYMLNYHADLNPDHVHPFSSKWYTWPLDIRPVLFFSQQDHTANTISTLSTMGNPFIWWSGLIAAICLAVWLLMGKTKPKFAWGFTAVGALSQYLPWCFITREVFIYHYFATVPFLIIIIVFWLMTIEKKFKYGKIFGYVFVGVAVAFFIAFYPVITGVPANADYINSIRWLESWPFY